MVVSIQESYHGIDSLKVESSVLALWVTRSTGPRVLGLSYQGGKNLFAVLPEAIFEHPNGEAYHFRGGHRLWIAPEDPKTTYLPDNAPVEITEHANGIEAVQPVEAPTGLQKSIRITFPKMGQACVELEHKVQNQGRAAVKMAPWAVTQLAPGGVAVLPMETQIADPHGMLPNRQLALWPYSAMDNPSVKWSKRYIYVQANFQDGAFKVGLPNRRGWLGYWNHQTLFVKKAAYDPEKEYYDFNSSSECYCNPHILELETLGPKTILEPGEAVSHKETWLVFGGISLDLEDDRVDELLKTLVGIEND